MIFWGWMLTDIIACDVLIVGGGPAGLSVASHLGDDVHSIVVHQDAEIGLPVRTSGGTWQRDMQALGIPPEMYRVIDQLDFFSDNAEARFAVKDDKMAVMDVTAVYRHLASLSDGKRSELMTGAKFLSCIEQEDGQFLSQIRSRDRGNFNILSRMVIDASGWQCAVLESLGLGQKPQRTGVGIEYEFLRGDFEPNRAVLFVGSSALTGYGWIFPTPDNRLRLGIGVINPDTDLTPRQVMDAFEASGQAARYGIEIPEDYETNAGIIPSEPYDPELVFGNVVRTGDAANFATPTVGEGIRIAVEYGRLLGTEVTAHLGGDDKALGRYEAAARREFQRDYKFGFMVNKRIAGYSPERWDKSVARLGRLSEQEMTALVRSRFNLRTMARTIWLNFKAKVSG
ncbi:FAD-dependent monooxygenase [Neptunicoccus cionae]|uniref:FAD-dependent monooxygenase n=1 Tax=Neptunicoccus cionae TaxID=2035344 RepID=UPI0015E0D763|nr:NAD(P)/FAD-dependent oxidoreductase [Amylibacter cionae]